MLEPFVLVNMTSHFSRFSRWVPVSSSDPCSLLPLTLFTSFSRSTQVTRPTRQTRIDAVDKRQGAAQGALLWMMTKGVSV